MTNIKYKDYIGSVEYEDGQLVLQVLHIDDVVTTTIDSASQAESAFADLVEDYIATCVELGKDPCKSFKGSFNVRVTPQLHRAVAMAASAMDETMNAWIAKALEARVERQKARRVFMDQALIRLRSLSSGATALSQYHVVHTHFSGGARRNAPTFPPALERQLTH